MPLQRAIQKGKITIIGFIRYCPENKGKLPVIAVSQSPERSVGGSQAISFLRLPRRFRLLYNDNKKQWSVLNFHNSWRPEGA